MTRLVDVLREPTATKEYVAVFSHPQSNGPPIIQRVRFGQRTDGRLVSYIEHGNTAVRAAWRARHRHENRRSPYSPAALSWHLLWGESTNLHKNVDAFRKRYKLE